MNQKIDTQNYKTWHAPDAFSARQTRIVSTVITVALASILAVSIFYGSVKFNPYQSLLGRLGYDLLLAPLVFAPILMMMGITIYGAVISNTNLSQSKQKNLENLLAKAELRIASKKISVFDLEKLVHNQIISSEDGDAIVNIFNKYDKNSKAFTKARYGQQRQKVTKKDINSLELEKSSLELDWKTLQSTLLSSLGSDDDDML